MDRIVFCSVHVMFVIKGLCYINHIADCVVLCCHSKAASWYCFLTVVIFGVFLRHVIALGSP